MNASLSSSLNTLRLKEYLRKSTESEERQELSIPAQRRELAAVIERHDLKVVGEPIEESMSAKAPGTRFTQLLEDIRRGKADGILCWQLNRLARNPLDGGAIMWALGNGTIKAIVTPDRIYTGTSDDKLLMSIIFGMATKFVDDLSVDVKRGNREALERGLWPHYPKTGYIRDPETKSIVPDPERFHLVQKMWHLLLTGVPPLDILRIANQELGLRTRARGKIGGKPLGKSQLYVLFRDSFYAGIMKHGGTRAPGTHPPMITMAEFERAQALIDKNLRKKPVHKSLPFTYRGLIRCGACGAMVTAQYTYNRQGKQYIYYYCCRKEKRYAYCPERSIEERYIETQLREFVATLAPPPSFMDNLLVSTEEMLQAREHTALLMRKDVEAQLLKVDHRLERLRQLCADEVITEEDYLLDRNKLVDEKAKLQERLDDTSIGVERLLKPFSDCVSFLKQAKDLFDIGERAQKRTIICKFFSNIRLLFSENFPIDLLKKL